MGLSPRSRVPKSASPTFSSSFRPTRRSIRATPAARWSICAGGSQAIGFAIPANMVRVVVASAKSGGSAVKRPWLGAKLQDVNAEIAESLGLKRPGGALVANVSSGSPAARAGLKTGDLIVTVDGQNVDDPNAFDYRFATKI